MQAKKTLLFFAHRGEAEAFLKRPNNPSPWRLLPNHSNILGYENNDHYLFITGEGLDRALFVASFVLSRHASSVVKCVNLGVAGALRGNESAPIGRAFSVRNAYRFGFRKPVFRSFPCERVLGLAFADCISTNEAVNTSNSREELGHFAGLVDQELWATCYAAAQHDLPLVAVKVVSDLAGDDATLDAVRKDKKAFSEVLFEAYRCHVQRDNNADNKDKIEPTRAFFERCVPFSEELHITASQWRILPQLLQQWLRKQGQGTAEGVRSFLERDEGISGIRRSASTPKAKTKALMAYLRNDLDPLLAEARRSFQALQRRYAGQNIRLEVDEHLRHGRLKVSFSAGNEAEWNAATRQLLSIPYGEVGGLLGGGNKPNDSKQSHEH